MDRLSHPIEPLQIGIVSEQNVRLQAVLIVRIDAGADARIWNHKNITVSNSRLFVNS